MSPLLELLAAAFVLSVSVLVLANIVLAVASLLRRRRQMLQLLAPIARFAALFLLSDSPSGVGATVEPGNGCA